MRLSIAIQHHPARAGLLPTLLASLAAAHDPVEVVADPAPPGAFPSPWRTYRHALEQTRLWATHRLILQDDVQLCAGFPQAAAAAVAARPDRLIAFFVAGRPAEHARAVRDAGSRDEPWVELANDRWCPAIALAWPLPMIRPLLDFVDAQGWPEKFRADDEIIGRWLAHADVRPLATVPSLVQHPDVEPSLIGMRAWAGADEGRVAACWVGDCDPATINWA